MATKTVKYINAYDWRQLSPKAQAEAIDASALVTVQAGNYVRALTERQDMMQQIDRLTERVEELKGQLKQGEQYTSDVNRVRDRLGAEVTRLNTALHVLVDLLGGK
jgi:anti-sigma28 factor (negative regulator of flagellin synthesis)